MQSGGCSLADVPRGLATVTCGLRAVSGALRPVIRLTRFAEPITYIEVFLYHFTIIAEGRLSCQTTISW